MRDLPKIKDDRELAKMRIAGRMVADVLHDLAKMVAPGVTTRDLNETAHRRMKELGGEPSFLNYLGFPAVICISIDEEVVHGIPGGCKFQGEVTKDRALEAGQIVSLDCGVKYEGYHGDAAVTLPVGEIPPEVTRLLEVCRGGLWAGIKAVRPGATILDVAAAVESHVHACGKQDGRNYGIVEQYVGHGVGRALHEAPQVPNYVPRDRDERAKYLHKLSKGYVIAIEPMVNLGTKKTRVLKDGWTVITTDGLPSAHFEHTIAAVEGGYEVLTLRQDGSSTH